MCAGQGIASKKAVKGILIVTSIMLFSFNFVYYLEKEAVVAYCGELRTRGDPAIGHTYTHELSAKWVVDAKLYKTPGFTRILGADIL